MYLFLDNDPAQFCLIKDLSYELISKILELGPCQPQPEELPEQCYPKRKGHRFIPNLNKKKLPDGSVIKRDWLSYSKSNIRMFCLSRMLFPGKGKETPNKAWILNGFENWSTCSLSITGHEVSSAHVFFINKTKN